MSGLGKICSCECPACDCDGYWYMSNNTDNMTINATASGFTGPFTAWNKGHTFTIVNPDQIGNLAFRMDTHQDELSYMYFSIRQDVCDWYMIPSGRPGTGGFASNTYHYYSCETDDYTSIQGSTYEIHATNFFGNPPAGSVGQLYINSISIT